MISKEKLTKITPTQWEIPQSYRADMLVPARIFATQEMLDVVFNDRSLEQLVNVATLQGIQGHAFAMPDAHEGYGFPIGGVAATQWPDGVISPGGIGYDINCGVRLLKTTQSYDDIKGRLKDLSETLFRMIPSGVGKGGSITLTSQEIDQVLTYGAQWALKNGYATQDDLRHIESNGRLENADPSKVSEQAKQRGLDQIGTLGSGNHFVEVDIVDEIYDTAAAGALGLWKNQATILIHTGSRGLGHQVATDYIKIMMNAMPSYNITLPDRELACVPFSSPEGTDYFNAMAAAANFAWANRQVITWEVRQAWNKIFAGTGDQISLVYDVAHNIAKIEQHLVGKKKKKLIVHRKGATRSFGPEHEELAQEYRAIGQPVLIPGSMGTASYVLVGTEQAMTTSFGSCCHGAGRTMSRHAAKRSIHGKTLYEELMSKGIHIQAGSMVGLAEEAPLAYKDVDNVVNVVHDAGIARKVARLRPCAVIKG
ncbi:RtcB family protein [Candidatus Dependentiae bacterium]|nr:RtcB family protein [Candidatus Dependentiae bacterium]